MARYKESGDRNQLSFNLMSYEDMINAENPVRAIDAIISKMDVPSLGFQYSETASTGRKPYDPEDMFKLYTYSYFNGIRSSRKIERECHRNIEVIWLINGLAPDFKTIADFRKNNKQAIEAAFCRFSLLCGSLGLIGREIVAIDGSKFRACNSANRYFNTGKVKRMLARYEEQAGKYLALLDRNDDEEQKNPLPKIQPTDLHKKLEHIEKRVTELNEQLAKIETEGDIALTDPESKKMPMPNGGYDVCYNVQTAVDSKNHLVVAVDIADSPLDKDQLFPMALKAKREFGVERLQVVADRGYYSAKQFKQCAEHGITAIVPKPIHPSKTQVMQFAKEYFHYDLESDTYTCPQGAVLHHSKRRTASKTQEERYVNREACQNCSQREKCTTGEFRAIVEKPFERFSDAVDERAKSNPQMLLLRKCLVEHPFGTVKRSFGFTYFLTRGLHSIRVESCLHFFAYNLKRVVNIMGVKGIMAACPA